MDKRKTYVWYHGDCVDGLAAGWLMKKYFPTAICQPVFYGATPPEVPPGGDIYIVDFSYPGEILEGLLKQGHMVTVFDHHVSAVSSLNHYFSDKNGKATIPQGLRMVMDVTRSGTKIVYDHFHREGEGWSCINLTRMVMHINDRDLFKFQYEWSRPFHAAVMSYPLTFETLDKLGVMDWDIIMSIGETATRKDQQMIEWHLKNSVRHVFHDGVKVAAFNAPRYIVNEVAEKLTRSYPFVIGYYDLTNSRHIAFRSQQNDGTYEGTFVDLLANELGGGGHATAASARIALPEVIPKKPTMVKPLMYAVGLLVATVAIHYAITLIQTIV